MRLFPNGVKNKVRFWKWLTFAHKIGLYMGWAHFSIISLAFSFSRRNHDAFAVAYTYAELSGSKKDAYCDIFFIFSNSLVGVLKSIFTFLIFE